jgi:sugar phosphate isomerase/epimerase
MDRRTFIKSSLGGAVAVAGIRVLDSPVAAQPAAPAATPKAVMKLSSQEWLIPGRSFKEKVQTLEKWGAAGIELGGGFNPKDVLAALAGTKIKVSAICAADGPYIVSDEAQRRKAIDNAKRILDKAGEVGSTGVIMVPAFNGAKDQLVGKQARDLLVKEILPELGEHAVKAKCCLLMEPLNRGEAYFLRQLADAAAICRDVKSPGIGLMGDFYHMHIEETSDCGAFVSAGKYLRHVHLASRTPSRILPHQENSDYRDGFRGLQMIGYQNYMSLECGRRKDTDPMIEIPATFRFLEKQWEEATVA